VELTAEDRPALEPRLQKGKSRARKLPRARLLLQADEGVTEEERATALAVGGATVERPRQRVVEATLEALNDGSDSALYDNPVVPFLSDQNCSIPIGKPGGTKSKKITPGS
jgi:hypothetical protein